MTATKLYFCGGETPQARKLLLASAARRVVVNFWHLRDRLPKSKVWKLADHFPEDIEIFVDSGGSTANKDPGKYSDDEWKAYAYEYIDFVEINMDRLSLVSEFDIQSMGPEFIDEQRNEYWDQVPADKFVPIWHETNGLEDLEHIASRYERLGVINVGESLSPHRLNTIAAKYGVKLHGSMITKPDNIKALHLDTASTASWLSPRRFGETIVWDGNRIRRFPAASKEQTRRRYRTLFKKAGFDPKLIEEDDAEEVSLFTIWSYVQFEESLDKSPRKQDPEGGSTPEGTSSFPENADGPMSDLDGLAGVLPLDPAADSSVALARRPERRPLPVMSFEEVKTYEADGESVQSVAAPVSYTLRQCSNCHVAAHCPEVREGFECAFEFPVELRTRDQILGFLRGVIAMQAGRVAFASFAEQLEGGFPDKNLSAEIDRLFTITTNLKEIEDNREYLKIEARAGAGRLSQLFGREAVSNLQQLDPGDQRDSAQTSRVIASVLDIEDAEIIEAEPLDPTYSTGYSTDDDLPDL